MEKTTWLWSFLTTLGGFGSLPHPRCGWGVPSASVTPGGVSLVTPFPAALCMQAGPGCSPHAWLGTPCAPTPPPLGMGGQESLCPCPSWVAWSPPHQGRRWQHGWGGIPLVPARRCQYRAMEELGFWGASLPSHPGNATFPSTTRSPVGMLAFGDRIPMAAVPYVASASLPCDCAPSKGGFSCLRQPREHRGCLRPPCSAAVYFPISLHQEILAGLFILAASFTVELHKTSPLMPK